MTRTQRIVRVGIWVLLPFMLLGSLDLAATLAAAFNEERDLKEVSSPNGRYTATLAKTQEPCGDSHTVWNTVVYVERRFAGVKTGMYAPLCVEGETVRVELEWSGEDTLRIRCGGCSTSNLGRSERNWGKLRFAYDLGN